MREEKVHFARMGRIIWLDADEEILWQRASRHSIRPCSNTRPASDLPSCCGNDYRAADGGDHRINASRSSIAAVTDEIIALL